MDYDQAKAVDLLRVGVGNKNAVFRQGQEDAIRHVIEGRGRLLVVQKTGWGKSFVYFIATKLLRDAGDGPAILISPLLSLMRNQIAAAEKMGVRAETINSDNQDEWGDIEGKVARDDVDILLVSPERLANDQFVSEVLSKIAGRIALLVIDEAHCISDWGHDFRPHYRLIERAVKTMPPNLRILATTATANNRVMDDLAIIFGPNVTTLRGDLNRPSLALQTINLPHHAQRMAWLAEQLPRIHGSGIIYTLTKRDAITVADWLRHKGLAVEAYTGASGEDRPVLEEKLLHNDVKALVATTALGMGYDKPDLAFVFHYQMPGSVVAYYQQVGRAGRALDKAYGVLLCGYEDDGITDYFIENAFPTRNEVSEIIEAIKLEPNGLSVNDLLQKVNIGKGRIEKALLLLSLESPAPVVKQGGKWQLTAAELSKELWRQTERLTELRRSERKEMAEYATLEFGSHMPFLIKALDGDQERISSPPLPPLPEKPSRRLVAEASAYLKNVNIIFEPRKQWPPDGLPSYGVNGRIAPEHRCNSGKALCRYGDAGWGARVNTCRYSQGYFDDELVDACVRLVRKWAPDPAPRWVTCVPSLRHQDIVPGFAERLAKRLNIPFRQSILKIEQRPEQKAMANSRRQALNVDGAFGIVDGAVLPGPVLLVDDIVKSKWTMTICGWLLRTHGAGEVWPLALSYTGTD